MFRVQPGTYNGQYPTLDGVPLDVGPTSPLGSGRSFVYLKATYVLTIENDYAHGGTLAALEVVVVPGTMPVKPLGPKGPGPSVEFYILLASFNEGAKTGQSVTSHLNAQILGISNKSGKANLLVTRVV